MNHDKKEQTKPCDACGKEIKFVKMKSGNFMPVNAEMQIAKEDLVKGTFILPDGKAQKGIKAGQCYYTPHWGNCSDAERFRS